MGSKGKRYSPKFKFNVVLEALKSPEKSDAAVARAFEVHPATLSRWKKEFQEKGAEVFGGSEEVQEYEERIVDDRQFGKVLVDRLFERFWRVMREEDEVRERTRDLCTTRIATNSTVVTWFDRVEGIRPCRSPRTSAILHGW